MALSSARRGKSRLAFSTAGGAFGGLLFGYDIGAISSAAPGLRFHFALSPAALGLCVSAALAGTIVGSACAGVLADRLERRNTLRLAAFGYLCAAIAVALSANVAAFSVFRALCGFAIGVISVVSPMYLAEIAPAQIRGRLVGAFQFSVSIGVVAAFAFGYFASLHWPQASAWRYDLASGVAPALLCLVFLCVSCQSPRWLATNNRSQEALQVLAGLNPLNARTECQQLQQSAQRLQGPRTSLWSREYLRPILLAVSIAAFNQLTGVNAFLYYVIDVFGEVGSGHLNGRQDALIISILGLVVTMAAVSIVDKVGRRPLLLGGTVAMGMCLLCLSVVHAMHWPPVLAIFLVAAYNASFGFSQGVVIWVYLSEIFPLPVRARGQSLGTTVHWVTSGVVVAAFPAVISSLHEKVFLILAVLMGLQLVVILFFYPETKRTQLELIASTLASSE